MSDVGKNIPKAAILAIVLAAVLRLPALGTAPPPLNQDEASRGYDAWCIWETGADRHGDRWPLFLKSFGPGDYTAALTTYLTVPFVAIFGPTTAAIRLPDALFGVATVALIFFWLRRQFDATTASLAALILAMDPWHIALSRTAHESGFTPFFLLLALASLHFAGLLPNVRAVSPATDKSTRTSIAWATVAGLSLAAHTWAYPATRLFTPLFLIALCAIYFRCYRRRFRNPVTRRPILAAAVALFIGAAPLWYTALTHPHRLASRARATLLIHEGRSTAEIANDFLSNYASAFDPRYGYLQSDEMSGASIPNVGLHLPALAPLWLIGLVQVIGRARKNLLSRLLLAWLFLHPIPAAVCGDWNPHPLRSVAGLGLFPIIAAIGGRWLLDRLAPHPRRLRWAVGALASLTLAANVAHFTDAYYRRFTPAAAGGYQSGLVQAMEFVAEQGKDAETILVTNRANQPYIYALWLDPIDPHELRRDPPIFCDGPKGFHQVVRAGRFLFVPPNPIGFPEAGRRFQEALGCLKSTDRVLVIESLQDPHGPENVGEVLFRSSAGPKSESVADEWTYVVRPWRPNPNRSRPPSAPSEP